MTEKKKNDRPRPQRPHKPVNKTELAQPMPGGLEPATDARPRHHEWIWPGRILASSLNMLEGRKGAAKSTIAAAVCAHVTGGPCLPDAKQTRTRGVIWYGPEESWEASILPRLSLAGANLNFCFRLSTRDANGRPRRLTLPSGIDELEQMMRAYDIGLLVLDPFGSMADPTIDLRMEQQARLYLEAVAQAMDRLGATCLLTRHLRKGSSGDPLDAGLGSVGIGNVCRTILRADRHPTDDTLRVLSAVAVSHGAKPPSLLYTMKDHGHGVTINWQGSSQICADILAEGRGGAADRDEAKDAINFLKSILANGPVDSETVIKEYRKAGLGDRSIRKAKTELGIKPGRKSESNGGQGNWQWVPPKDGWPEV